MRQTTLRRARRSAQGPLSRLISSLILVAAFIAAGAPAKAQDEPQAGLENLAIVTASGKHDFSVEVMRSGPQRERGLMFRRFLPQDRGMLFIFETERPIAMWMKNTYLPLDMIFIARTGRVIGLAENTEPLSERIIPSGGPAFGVLEVNAGAAAKIGLKVGDAVLYPAFGK